MKKTNENFISEYKMNLKNKKAITLISLVITIIILLILTTVTINIAIGNNGVINKAKYARETIDKQTAIEIIKLKITNIELNYETTNNKKPTLQEVANELCKDDEIQYVELKSQVADLDKIIVGNHKKIYTKLKKYTYEFVIDNSLKITVKEGNVQQTDVVKRSEFETLRNTVTALEKSINEFAEEPRTEMKEPIRLTTAIMEESGTTVKEKGIYLASSATYGKTNSTDINNYLTFTQDSGWKVKKVAGII